MTWRVAHLSQVGSSFSDISSRKALPKTISVLSGNRSVLSGNRSVSAGVDNISRNYNSSQVGSSFSSRDNHMKTSGADRRLQIGAEVSGSSSTSSTKSPLLLLTNHIYAPHLRSHMQLPRHTQLPRSFSSFVSGKTFSNRSLPFSSRSLPFSSSSFNLSLATSLTNQSLSSNLSRQGSKFNLSQQHLSQQQGQYYNYRRKFASSVDDDVEPDEEKKKIVRRRKSRDHFVDLFNKVKDNPEILDSKQQKGQTTVTDENNKAVDDFGLDLSLYTDGLMMRSDTDRIRSRFAKEYAVFNAIDRNKDGVLSTDEIHQMCESLHIPELSDLVIELLDHDDDDEVTFNEFVQAFKSLSSIRQAARMRTWNRCFGIGIIFGTGALGLVYYNYSCLDYVEQVLWDWYIYYQYSLFYLFLGYCVSISIRAA